MAASSSNNKIAEFQKRVFASRFFTISVLLHFILVMTLGTVTLIKVANDPPDFTGGSPDGDGAPRFVSDETAVETPPEQVMQPMEQATAMDITTPTVSTEAASIDVITAAGATDAVFTVPSFPGMQVSASATTIAAGPTIPNVGTTGFSGQTFASLPMAQKVAMKNFTAKWTPPGKGGGGRGSNPAQRHFTFTAYLAKYRGGDWASTNQISKDGKILRGSLPNLLYMMSRRSNNRIQANPHAVPLDLSSDEIFTICPPFIFFTGHKDFVLTEKEVENLRKYVMLGGCIWGDSSLPGHRSRFDIAFRREMRRVIPDTNKDWEQLPANHALFTRPENLYYRDMTSPPPGINFYAEPVYALKYVGEVAVIYTANDYGDMWQVGLTEDFKFDLSRDKNGQYVAMNGQIWSFRNVYFRNITEESVAATYKFGTNLVIHLLTRWEDHLRNVPSSL